MRILGGILDQMKSWLSEPHSTASQSVTYHHASSSHYSGVDISVVANAVLPLEGHNLDQHQLSCIACEAHSQLVLAGAGTGKTTTIVGLVKYLLNTNQYQPSEILALSFTNASAQELCERIKRETGRELDAMTFHKLGMNIIAAVSGEKPSVFDGSLNRFVSNTITRQMRDAGYSRLLARYLLNKRRGETKTESDFSDAESYQQYLKENPPITLKEEKLKSYGEVAIANYLYCNGIAYEYERAYEHNTANDSYAQYHPDFYLPETGTYIEYFAFDRQGNVPPWFSERDGQSATATYRASYEWKKALHSRYGTDCIELFSYQYGDELTAKLKEELAMRSIPLKPISADQLWSHIEDAGNALASVAALFSTLIALLKSNEMSINDAIAACRDRRTTVVFHLLAPIYSAYESMLIDKGEIDFNDMINHARHYVIENAWHHNYRMVIIDEYQDISSSRFRLIKALRDQSDFRLVCVGDDWQSIYRFAGSDIDYITHFERWWGRGVVNRIEMTRRFPQSLIDVSGSFIMSNPQQERKLLHSMQPAVGFSVEELSAYTPQWAFEFSVRRMEELPQGASVLLLGRYGFDLNLVRNNSRCQVEWNPRRELQVVHLRGRPDLDIVFRTVHAAKGLEADYVFVLNNRDGVLGFPSHIENDPSIDVLLTARESYKDAEERRLFYVALTRARVKVFLLTVKGNESSFIHELRNRWGQQMEAARFECPRCGGRLLVRKGPYGKFWGCSNYRTTGCRFTRKIGNTSS